MATTTLTDRVLAHAVRAARVNLVFEQSPLPIFISPLVAGCLAWVLWPASNHRGLLAWVGTLVVLAVVRLALLLKFRRRASDHGFRLWDRRFVALYVAIAAVWGFGAAWLMPHDLAFQAIVFAFLMGMAGGAAATYGVHPLSGASLVVMMLPITVLFAFEADLPHRAMAFAGVVYVIAAYRANKLLAHYFRRSHLLAMELEAARDKAERLARLDVLTDLPNRRAFYEVGETALRQARRYEKPLALVMLDIDRFKAINDSYGHAAGDAAIKALARVLRETVRETDVAARIGGEEFALLLPETTAAQAAALAERLRQKLAAIRVLVERAELRFTASFGVAECDEQASNLDALLSRADAALYQAKQQGRDRVVAAGQ